MTVVADAPRHQLWATFSVKDHCRRGAFIAEVLLYDKLLIPVVPTEQHGLTPEEARRERERRSAEFAAHGDGSRRRSLRFAGNLRG